MIPAQATEIGLQISPKVNTVWPPRYRFQLEGYDSNWKENLGEVRMAIRFLDGSKQIIAGEEYDARHESSGWTGSLETSPFVPRHEIQPVPKDAAYLQLWIISAGPDETMGVYAVDNLSATLIYEEKSRTNQRIDFVSREGSLMNEVSGTPSGWARDGTSLGIAQIEPRKGRAPLLVLRDDRSSAFGGWLTTKLVPLAGVKQIVLDWSEAYSIGWGGNAHLSYAHLPVGEYRLQLQILSVEGLPTDNEILSSVVVVPPFYEEPWFGVGVGLMSSLIIGLLVRQLTKRRMQRRLQILEHEQIVAIERSRIARDLHDNMGADLTHLALLSDLAQSDAAAPEKIRQHLDDIFELARNLTRQVDEIVWAVNPNNDRLVGFVPFLCNYVQNYLQAANIPLRIDIPGSLPDIPLSSAHRYNLFLVVKEAVHNIVKHSQTSVAWLRILCENDCLEICVEDQGCGLVSDRTEGHDGLENMRQRITAMGGEFSCRSEPQRGTKILLRIHLHAPRPQDLVP